jgi:hypothetical protein
MTVTTTLIERLSSETGRRLLELAQRNRRHALRAISRVYVVVTDDGVQTRETYFEQPPTLGELMDRVGPDVFVVSVQMRRRSMTSRNRPAIAAE